MSKKKHDYRIAVGDAVAIDPNEVVVTDARIVYKLAYTGTVTIAYADGAYSVDTLEHEFNRGDQHVFLGVDDHGETKTLDCHLLGWRLTKIGEIKTKLIPLLRHRPAQ